jgi:hypothetical protein
MVTSTGKEKLGERMKREVKIYQKPDERLAI